MWRAQHARKIIFRLADDNPPEIVRGHNGRNQPELIQRQTPEEFSPQNFVQTAAGREHFSVIVGRRTRKVFNCKNAFRTFLKQRQRTIEFNYTTSQYSPRSMIKLQGRAFKSPDRFQRKQPNARSVLIKHRINNRMSIPVCNERSVNRLF